MANAYDASQGLEHVPPPQETNQAGTRICGLSRKMFWIVLVIALLLIGGIAGGVAGGLASRKSANSADSSASPTTSSTSSPTSTSSPSSTSTTGSSPGALANSQIAALNWTDSDNLLRRAIFYQHNGALLFSQYHTANSSWTQFNISAVFESETSADALNVKAGTPLAVAAVSLDDVNFLRDTEGISAFVASLYFIDSSNHLRELYSRDFDLATWSQGDLKDASLVAADGSHISALAYYCPRLTDAGPTDANCTDQFVITYQNSNGEVMKADGPNWNSPQTVDRAYENSSIAIIPLASGEGRNTFDVSEMRIFYYSDNVIDFMYWNYYGLMEGM